MAEGVQGGQDAKGGPSGPCGPWGDHVDNEETNPFRVDSTQWTGFLGKEGKDVGQTELKRRNFLYSH